MANYSERLAQIFKSAGEVKVARDFLDQKLRETPPWIDREPAEARRALALAGDTAETLRAWCAEWLTAEQIQVLAQALRMASQHQRVYKRTVMLSPRAHLLVKTLSEMEKLNMSEVIEQHLENILGEHYGLMLRTLIDERTGQIIHDILPASSPP